MLLVMNISKTHVELDGSPPTWPSTSRFDEFLI